MESRISRAEQGTSSSLADHTYSLVVLSYLILSYLIFTGIGTVIGIAVWGGELDDHNQDIHPYAGAEGVIGSLLAILAGVFAILDLVGCGSG